ncbi:MAG: hypothetical protein ACTSU5_15380 [Promethearchaeota archaeon]
MGFVGFVGLSGGKRGGWGNLDPIFKLARITFKYRLFKLARLVPEEIVHGIGAWFGERFISGSGVRRRIVDAVKLLYGSGSPPVEPSKVARWAIKFMGLLAFDTIFVFPNLKPPRLRKSLVFENAHLFREAAARKKGVIVVSVHLSQFFRGVVSVPLLDPERKSYAIANVKNVELYSLPFLENDIHLVPSVAYSRSRPTLERILLRGDVLFVAWDMGGGGHQLKVKFFDYLLPTPGSVVSLALRTGASVLPVVMLPRGGHKNHTIRFLESFNVEERASKKETFGYYNALLNALFAPYIRQYPHLWEEVLGFATHRTRVAFDFPGGADFSGLVAAGAEFLRHLVETSWEVGRDDDFLLELVNRLKEIPVCAGGQGAIPATTVELDRTSVVRVFLQVFDLLLEFAGDEAGERISALKGELQEHLTK